MKRTWLSWFAILAIATMAFAVTGCSDDDDPVNTPYDVTGAVLAAGDDYFDDYKVTFNGVTQGVNVAPGAFFANVEDYYVVDLRGAADFANAHVIGARNVGLADLVDELDSMPTDELILFMCYTGQTASFATAVTNLIGTETGHVAVNLKYGASELMPETWVKADGSFSYPTKDDYASIMETTASPAKHAVTPYPALEANVNSAAAALKVRAKAAIDAYIAGSAKGSAQWAAMALPTEAYVINYFTESNYLEGHLPSAVLYQPGEFVTTAALNTLPTDMPVGVYCYTGQTSAQVVAYLQMLGYDAKTVMYGVQTMAYSNTAINDVQWHPADDGFKAILEGPGVQ